MVFIAMTWGILISEASNISLNIVAETIEALGLETFERTYLAEFFSCLLEAL